MIVTMTGRTLTNIAAAAARRCLWIGGARLLALAAACLACPLLAWAADDDVDVPHDARMEGYQLPMALEGSPALTWMLFAVLAVLCVSVLFKNAKRSHLD
jgi:hypothetical protein